MIKSNRSADFISCWAGELPAGYQIDTAFLACPDGKNGSIPGRGRFPGHLSGKVKAMLEWLQSLLVQYGYGALFLALFLNNAGIPVPGTTALLGAGLLAQRGGFSLGWTVLVGTAACFLGSNCGYWFGHRYGLVLLEKIKWLRLTHRRIRHMERFFGRYGAKGVFFARFVALFHPVIGLMAGVGKTPKGPFLFYNFLGSAAYTVLYALAGYYFGKEWGLHGVWELHMAFYAFFLVIALLLLRFFWRHSIHEFFGFVFFRKRG